MNIKSFTFNPFQENTYIVYDETKECLIIDPGCYTDAEREELKAFIEEKELTPVKLINTHCHIDHVLGNKFASEQWDLELYMHKEDLPVLEKVGDISKMYGIEDYESSPYPKHFLAQGDTLTFGKSSFVVASSFFASLIGIIMIFLPSIFFVPGPNIGCMQIGLIFFGIFKSAAAVFNF